MAGSRTILSSLTLSAFSLAFTSLAVTSLVLQTSPVQAAEECGETLCADGFQCALTTIRNCEMCGDMSPVPESIGDEDEGAVQSTLPDEMASCGGCIEEEIFYCQRANCETDSDCGEEMVCATSQSFSCPGAEAPPQFDCEPGEDCPVFVEPEPVECTSSEVSQCAYRRELPCEEALDCGEGYDCLPQEIWTCGGSAGIPMQGSETSSPDDSAPQASPPQATTPGSAAPEAVSEDPEPNESMPVSEEGNCSREPTGEGYCRITEIACETDTECPADWSCVQLPGSCFASSDGTSGCTEPENRCYPNQEGGFFDSPVPPPRGGIPGQAGTAEGDMADDPGEMSAPPSPGGDGANNNGGSPTTPNVEDESGSNDSDDNGIDAEQAEPTSQEDAEEQSANTGHGRHWGRKKWHNRKHRKHSAGKRRSRHHGKKSKHQAHKKSHKKGNRHSASKSHHRSHHGW